MTTDAMEEPLHRLTSVAVLFSDVTAESTEGPELRLSSSVVGQTTCRKAFRLFRFHHGHPPWRFGGLVSLPANGGAVATHNTRGFQECGIELIDPFVAAS